MKYIKILILLSVSILVGCDPPSSRTSVYLLEQCTQDNVCDEVTRIQADRYEIENGYITFKEGFGEQVGSIQLDPKKKFSVKREQIDIR